MRFQRFLDLNFQKVESPGPMALLSLSMALLSFPMVVLSLPKALLSSPIAVLSVSISLMISVLPTHSNTDILSNSNSLVSYRYLTFPYLLLIFTVFTGGFVYFTYPYLPSDFFTTGLFLVFFLPMIYLLVLIVTFLYSPRSGDFFFPSSALIIHSILGVNDFYSYFPVRWRSVVEFRYFSCVWFSVRHRCPFRGSDGDFDFYFYFIYKGESLC